MALEKIKDFFKNIGGKGIDGSEDEYYEEDSELNGGKMILFRTKSIFRMPTNC